MPGTPSRLTRALLLCGAAALGLPPAHAQPVDLPRLTGIMIEGGRKVAIFSDPVSGSKTAGEGDHVGAFTVAVIKRGEARLSGPGGDYVVQPSGDMGSRSFWVSQTPVVPLIDPAYREAVTENDQ